MYLFMFVISKNNQRIIKLKGAGKNSEFLELFPGKGLFSMSTFWVCI